MRIPLSKTVQPAAGVLGCVLLLSASPESQGTATAAWPGLWGPGRSGNATADGSTIRSLREIWRRPSAGGYSEIAVVGGRAITLELRGPDDFIVALDASPERELWNVRIGRTYRGHGGSEDGPIATPAIDGNDVFAIGPYGHLAAVDAATGRERWRHDLIRESYTALQGAQLVCLDTETGQARWRERTGEGTLVDIGPHLLFLSASTDDLRIIRATPDAFTQIVRARVLTPDVRAVTGASVAGRRVYLRNLKELAAFELADKG